jgi:hypothetical protein
MLLQDLRVDQSGQNNPDAIGCLSLKHDLHTDQRTAERRPNRTSSPALLKRQAFPCPWRRTCLARHAQSWQGDRGRLPRAHEWFWPDH